MPPLSPTALIVGCGYVGRRLAMRLIDEGRVVYGTTRRPSQIDALAHLGVRPIVLSVERRQSYEQVRSVLDIAPLDVYYLVPPGRNTDSSPTPRQVVIDGLTNLLMASQTSRIRRMVMASSTGVYSQRNGERVDADTPPTPAPGITAPTSTNVAPGDAPDHRAQLLLDGERLWLEAGEHAYVVRLAGLYGPDRIVGLDAVRRGDPILGSGDALLNLIHVDDAVELLIAVMRASVPGRIELGCDGQPVRRIDYYHHLADLIGAPRPKLIDDPNAIAAMGLDPERVTRATSKACNNNVTTKRTGWSPRYHDYREGLAALFDPQHLQPRPSAGG